MKLFQKIYKEKARRIKVFQDQAGLLDIAKKRYIHGYDVRKIYTDDKLMKKAIHEMEVAERTDKDFLLSRLSLPGCAADLHWFEFTNFAIVLDNLDEPDSWIWLMLDGSCHPSTISVDQLTPPWHSEVACVIWLINTPHLIDHTLIAGRPRMSLARQNSNWVSGGYELLKLKIKKSPQAVNLSKNPGSKHPWHFRKGHFRRVNGLLRWIDGYWAGDKRLGTKHRQYEVVES